MTDAKNNNNKQINRHEKIKLMKMKILVQIDIEAIFSSAVKNSILSPTTDAISFK